MRKIAILLFLVLPQDADRLVEQLGDEEIVSRERAAEKLVEMGPSARPALERAAKSADPEIRARVRTILGEIELAEQRARSLGPAGRVTLPRGEHALQAVVDRVREQTGLTLKVPDDQLGSRVSIEAKDQPLLEFVDRLCQAHGTLALAPRQPADAIELAPGTPWRGPTGYSGPFRISLDRLRLERRDPYDSRFERGSLLLEIAWQPNVRPIAAWYTAGRPEFILREIVGDDGKKLDVEPPLKAPYSGMSLDRTRERAVLHFATFRHPAKGVRRLSTIRGHVDVLLPLKIETVVFAKPLESVGQLRKAGAYTITLKACESTSGKLSATVHIEAPVEGPGLEKPQQRVEIRSRFDPHAIELVSDDGKVLRPQTANGSHASGSDADDLRTETDDSQLLFPEGAGAKELRLRFIADYFARRIEFEFKDVELP